MKNRSIASVAAENITLRRKASGLTQAQVASRISVEKESVSRMESGKISLNLERLQQFADLFGCPVSELLKEPSQDVQVQAETIAALISHLEPEEREMVINIVADVVRLCSVRKPHAPE